MVTLMSQSSWRPTWVYVGLTGSSCRWLKGDELLHNGFCRRAESSSIKRRSSSWPRLSVTSPLLPYPTTTSLWQLVFDLLTKGGSSETMFLLQYPCLGTKTAYTILNAEGEEEEDKNYNQIQTDSRDADGDNIVWMGWQCRWCWWEYGGDGSNGSGDRNKMAGIRCQWVQNILTFHPLLQSFELNPNWMNPGLTSW